MGTHITPNVPDTGAARRAAQTPSTQPASKLAAAVTLAQRTGRGVSDWYSGAANRAAIGFAGTAAPGALNNLKIGAGGLGALYGLISLPGAYSTAYSDVRNAVRNGDWAPAVESSSKALRTTLTTAQGSLALAAKIAERLRYPGIEKAALKAVQDVVGAAHFGGLELDKAASQSLAKLAASKAMVGESLRDVDYLAELAKAQKGVLGGALIDAKMTGANALQKLGELTGLDSLKRGAASLESGVARQGERAAAGFLKEGSAAAKAAEGALMESPAAVLKVAGKAGTEAAEVAAKAGAEAAAKAGAEVAAKAGAEALARTGATTLAKAAGRFAPGVNIAIAGLDIANCAAAWADKHASIAKKVTSTVTALGSIVAATDIPIVSQIGAAVSIGSSVVGAAIENAGAIKHVAQEVGEKVGHVAQEVGHEVSHVAQEAGHEVSHVAQEVGHAVKDAGEKAVNAVKDVGSKIKHFFHL